MPLNRDNRKLDLLISALVTLLALTGIPVGGGSVEAAEKKRPDLVVSTLARVPSTVTVGKPFTIKATIKNKGRSPAASSTLGFFLSYDRVKGPSGTRLDLQRKVSRIPSGGQRTVEIKVRIPQSSRMDDSYLLVCVDGEKEIKESNETNNCRSSQEQIEIVDPPTAYDLINEAFEQNEISEEEALLYKVYADAGDPQLPDQFGQLPEGFDGGEGFAQAAAEWDSLSPDSKADLDPFFSPPAYEGAYGLGPPSSDEGSEVALRSKAPEPTGRNCMDATDPSTQRSLLDTWGHVDTDHFRFWFYTEDQNHPLMSPPEVSKEAALFLAEEAETIYEQETTLWREPLSDEGLTCDGGDGRVDVYLIRRSAGKIAQAIPFPPGKVYRPGWIYINPGVTPLQDIRDVLAHEFAHLIQLAYKYPVPQRGPFEYGWLEEASATWAMDYVYPGDDYEHVFNDFFHTRPTYPLGECIGGLCRNGYRDWIFFYFLTQDIQDPQVMSKIWDNTESYDSVQAVDLALGGEFDQRFAKFALHGMNREDYDEFKAWDGINFGLFSHGHQHGPRTKVNLNGAPRIKYFLPGANGEGRDVEARAFEMDHYVFTDDKIKSIKLNDFGYRDSPAGPLTNSTRIKAWYKLANGERVTEDWTDLDQVSFCRDREDQDIQELVLFYVHGKPIKYLEHDPLTFPRVKGSLTASKRCTFPKTFTGTANGTFAYGTIVETWADKFKLERVYQGGGIANYELVREKIDWSLEGTSGCGDGTSARLYGSRSFTFEDPFGWVLQLNGPDAAAVFGPPDTYTFNLDPGPLIMFSALTHDCPGQEDKEHWNGLNCGEEAVTGDLPWDGRSHLAGSRTYLTGYEACGVENQIQVTWNWTLNGL